MHSIRGHGRWTSGCVRSARRGAEVGCVQRVPLNLPDRPAKSAKYDSGRLTLSSVSGRPMSRGGR
jgi:hypothetical protein